MPNLVMAGLNQNQIPEPVEGNPFELLKEIIERNTSNGGGYDTNKPEETVQTKETSELIFPSDIEGAEEIYENPKLTKFESYGDKKLYHLVVPEELQKNACLIVMGSEGRNEQIIKTDQDNALVIKDGIDVELYRPYMEKITAHLIDFGYPPCEGNIMVSNPFWCKTVSEYKNETAKWIESPDMQDYMDLAIFFDSFAVAGDKNKTPWLL